jgi:Protein of unknown function (DUF2934)
MDKNQSNGKKIKSSQASVKRQPRRTAGAKAATLRDSSAITPEERRQLISEAAYYRAQERGFAGGDPIQDWLEAEMEVSVRFRVAVPRGEDAALQ